MALPLALLGVMALAYLLWRAFGPQSEESHRREHARTPQRRSSGPIGPDDDPEFLADLDGRGDSHHDE